MDAGPAIHACSLQERPRISEMPVCSRDSCWQRMAAGYYIHACTPLVSFEVSRYSFNIGHYASCQFRVNRRMNFRLANLLKARTQTASKMADSRQNRIRSKYDDENPKRRRALQIGIACANCLKRSIPPLYSSQVPLQSCITVHVRVAAG
jgi:hypothetical protein